jgi:hypothetical protein
MPGIVVIVVSFAVAVLGFVQSNRTPPGQRGLFGLTALGGTLILLSIVGLVAGVSSQIKEQREAKEQRKQQIEDSNRLKIIAAKLNRIQELPESSAVSALLAPITNQISAIASQSRGSDFSMSDFTNSNFQMGNFTGTNFDNALFNGAVFRGAVFPHADLSDADLSEAKINSNTRLPKTR